jgi:hypothetical protein
MVAAEVVQGRLIDGSKVVDPDHVIRLTSEARRIFVSLRERARQDAPPAPMPWSPMRERARMCDPVGPHPDLIEQESDA